jgi:hypothetical protein
METALSVITALTIALCVAGIVVVALALWACRVGFDVASQQLFWLKHWIYHRLIAVGLMVWFCWLLLRHRSFEQAQQRIDTALDAWKARTVAKALTQLEAMAQREIADPQVASVASHLAAAFVQQQIDKGRTITIPSLDIELKNKETDTHGR